MGFPSNKTDVGSGEKGERIGHVYVCVRRGLGTKADPRSRLQLYNAAKSNQVHDIRLIRRIKISKRQRNNDARNAAPEWNRDEKDENNQAQYTDYQYHASW